MAKAGEEDAMENFKLFGNIIHDLRPSSPEKRSSTVDPGKSREKDIVAVEEGEAATSIGGIFSEYIYLPEDVAKVSKEGEEGASAVEAAAVVLATDTEGLVEDEERPFSDKGEAEKNRVKKPDKLVPCPRCKSLNTKFCYFNNCNAKQPRHYCRKCERYWTAGGTLRNVPRGSGRRKSKNSSAHWLHATEGISVRSDIVGSAPQLPHSTSSTVLPKNGIKRPSKEGKEGANECQSLPPTIDELAMASSSSVVTQCLCLPSKEAQATKTGLVGSSPFGFPMGQCPYGYGLFRWNNGAISPMDGGRSTKSSSPQLPQSSTVLPLKRHLEASPEVGNEGANECQPPPHSPLPTIDELTMPSSSLCLSSEDAQAATAGLVGSSPFSFTMGQWPYGYGLFGSNNVPISPTVVARSKKGLSPQLPESSSTIFPVERHFKEGKECANECQPPPPLSESAMASSSLGTQTLSAPKEAQATTTGLMGSSPFSFPMGQWPYGYGLLGWNNTMIPPIDGGRSFPTLSDPSFPWGPWMGVGFPWPLMPTPPYSPWNIPPPLFFPPWAGSTATGIASIMASGNNYGPPSSSPTLGKHSREVLQADSVKEGRLFTPKTLRIHDPKEAAQSSIWSALGLDNRPDFPISSGTILRGFPPKVDESVQTKEQDGQAFHVNPAAMTRSMAFHENS